MKLYSSTSLLATLVLLSQNTSVMSTNETPQKVGKEKAKQYEALASAGKEYVKSKAYQGKAKLYETLDTVNEASKSASDKGKEAGRLGAKSQTTQTASKAKKMGQEIAGATEQLWQDLTEPTHKPKN